MTRYLLAAEADKIQDFIFRSSRLREVVGGSQLLLRFCEEVPRYLLPCFGGNPDNDIIINDGGSFRILFDDDDQARDFGVHLAEVYRRATGGSLTVTEPVEVKEPIEQHFPKASEQAEENLRQAKYRNEGWQRQEHLPYMALCASCGTGLAVEHRVYYEGEKSQYLCLSCLNKSAERAGTDELGLFLKEFYQEVVEEAGLIQADWPGKKKRRNRTVIDPLEDIADYDSRHYVAYLLADGNSMGEVFSKCQNPEQMRALSKGLTRAIRRALAEPTKMIMAKNPLDNRPGFIPVMPLILGGDDLFALIPVPWALDFARCFCQKYEAEMAALVKDIGLSDVVPTVSVAVVICKHKHPYALAHAAGKARLKEAKQLSKRRILDGGQPCSAVDFEVVLGGRLVSGPLNGEVRATLRPYWVTNSEGDDWGLPVQWLLDRRWELRTVPSKRLSELQSLYDAAPNLQDPDKMGLWHVKLQRLVKRIERRNGEQGKAIEKALKLLGANEGNETGYWRKVDRYPEHTWYGHGLPDLLEAWDFALSLDKSPQEYEEG